MSYTLAVVILSLLFIDLLVCVLWYACSYPSSQILGPALVRGSADRRRVALTFDDGPASPFTEQILDILLDHRVSATFFVCGANVKRHPEILLRIHREGHTVGNHTYSHPYLYFLSRKQISEEIDRAQNVIQAAIGQSAALFRPPYGARWFGLYEVLRQRGIPLIQWSNNPHDWESSVEEIVRRTLRVLSAGDIILLHDGWQPGGGYLQTRLRRDRFTADPDEGNPEALGARERDRSHTVQALSSIIDGAREAGYEFVPLQELLPRTKTEKRSGLFQS
jgi:peptidoglycan/xylan/chitin deacetylase (PgdA/CDA1 family)